MNSRWMRNGFVYLLIAVAVIAIFFTLFSDPLPGGGQRVPWVDFLYFWRPFRLSLGAMLAPKCLFFRGRNLCYFLENFGCRRVPLKRLDLNSPNLGVGSHGGPWAA